MSDATKSAVADHYGIVPTPKAALIGGWAENISQFSKHEEAAFYYVTWFASHDVAKKIALEAGGPPTLGSVLADPEVQAKYPYYVQIGEGLKIGVKYALPVAEEINLILYTNINAATSGQITAEEAAHKIQEEVLKMMKERNLYKG